MENNNDNNTRIFKPKRPKIRANEEIINNEDYYQPLISETITLESIKNITYNRSIANNENKIKKEKKRKKNSEENKKSKKLTIKQKKLKNLINKFSSPAFKIKRAFVKWVNITFNHKKNMSGGLASHSEEEEEEDPDEDEEEEEEDEEKIKLMNDLNVNDLEEIEERPPNEEESALTSVMAKQAKNKNKISVALRKIIKYKNIFYSYFYHWNKVINIPNILNILQFQKLMKNSIINLEEKKKLSLLSLNFQEWIKKSEQLKSNEKKTKKKKKIIIYKKKNGEIEIKDKDNNTIMNINKNENDKLNLFTKIDKTDKTKKVKAKAIKKNFSSLKQSINLDESDIIDNQNKTISLVSSKNSIPINRNDSSNNILNDKTDEKNTKTKKIIKKVIKKVKKDKDKEKDKDNVQEEKVFSKTSELLPDLSRSTRHFKIMSSFNMLDNNSETDFENINISLSCIKKSSIAKNKIKKINIKNINLKSNDALAQKEKKRMNASFSQSTHSNIESLIDKIDNIFQGKNNDSHNDTKENETKKKKKNVQKKVKNNENKNTKEKEKISINKEENKKNILNQDESKMSETGEDNKQMAYKINKKKEFKIFSPSNNHYRTRIKQSDFVEFSVEENNQDNPEINNENIINTMYDSKETNMKSKNNDNTILNKEENEKYIIYKKALLILGRVIKSFKKRNRLESNDNEKINIYFNKWKTLFNKLDSNDSIKNNNKEDLNKEIGIKNNNVLEENKKITKKKKNVIINKSNKDVYHKYSGKKLVESEKTKSLNKMINIAQSDNKIQKDIINIIKRTDKKTLNNLDLGNYIKMLEMHNKKIYAYKIFCLFANYNENVKFCLKKNNPKKYYFNYWNKYNNNNNI
jgi:hypothetical protein